MGLLDNRDPMIPYVTATSVSSWNSPNCGNCYEVTGAAGTIFLTAIDLTVAGPAGEMHFDMHPDAFTDLMGGLTAGVGLHYFQGSCTCELQG